MKVKRAEIMGMCFGVRRAIRAARDVADPREVTIHGSLVHNEEVIREMEQTGFSITPEGDRCMMPSTPKVLITAHGICRSIKRRLIDAGKELIDLTCPQVRRIQWAARRLKDQDYYVILIGKRDHAEVKAITGDLEDYAVVSSPEDVPVYGPRKLGVLCQSTSSPDLVRRILRVVREKNEDAEITFIPTICRATSDRQRSLTSLLPQVQALVVVGGRNSHNTLQLAKTALSHRIPCQHVQSASGLYMRWFDALSVVGLTAGTSTPDKTIEEVYHRLSSIDAHPNVQAL